MTRKKNKLIRYRNNPKEVSFNELKALLEAFGFEVRNYSGGSHFSVSHSKDDIIGTMEPNVIPMKKPHVMEIYVKRAIGWIEKAITLEEAEVRIKSHETYRQND